MSQRVADHLQAVKNGGNAGVLSSKTQESQELQESQGVHFNAGSMPVPPTGDTETAVLHFLKVAEPQVHQLPVDSLPASLKAAFQERAAIAEVDGGLDRDGGGAAGVGRGERRPGRRHAAGLAGLDELPAAGVAGARSVAGRSHAQRVVGSGERVAPAGMALRPIPTAAPAAANGCSMVPACGCSTAP